MSFFCRYATLHFVGKAYVQSLFEVGKSAMSAKRALRVSDGNDERAARSVIRRDLAILTAALVDGLQPHECCDVSRWS